MQIISKSAAHTRRIGKSVARKLQKGDILCLFGDLGSGKTMLAKGVAEGLGIKHDLVISPTFVLLREHHRGKAPLYHFDFYRLNIAGEILALGYEEYFYGEGIALIEWADRLKWLMPKEFLKVELVFLGPTERLIRLTAFGKRYKELLRKIDEDTRY